MGPLRVFPFFLLPALLLLLELLLPLCLFSLLSLLLSPLHLILPFEVPFPLFLRRLAVAPALPAATAAMIYATTTSGHLRLPETLHSHSHLCLELIDQFK